MRQDYVPLLAVHSDYSTSTILDSRVFPPPCQPAGPSTSMVDETPSAPSTGPIESHELPLFDKWNVASPICKLPQELMCYIVELSLPESYTGETRIKALYHTRMVSRTWRNVIDSTPSLWRVISVRVPLHVNTTTIHRSGNSPLDVYVSRYSLRPHQTRTSNSELFELAVKEVRRWSRVTLPLPSDDALSEYLTSPAPLLRSLRVSSRHWDQLTTPMTLFGGIAPRLEVLEVQRLPIDWTSPFIQGLKALKLSNMTDGQISTHHILDILASSPLLKDFSIFDSHIDLPPSHRVRPVLELPNLNTICFEVINPQATQIILSSIFAPNCTSFHIRGWEDETVGAFGFPEPALNHFKDFQCRTLSANEASTIHFFDDCLQWESRSASPSNLEFDMYIPCNSAAAGVGWVTRVLGVGDEELVHDLEITLTHGRLDDVDLAAYRTFGSCRSVTKIEFEYNHSSTGPILDLIGTWQDIEGAEPSPMFPELKFLVLASREGWTLDDLEILVGRRFRGCEEMIGIDIPGLCIVLEEWYPDSYSASNFGLIQLQRLRGARGVERVERVLNKHVPGMLAVIYDDDLGL